MLKGLKSKPKKEKNEEKNEDSIASLAKEDQRESAQETNRKIIQAFKKEYLAAGEGKTRRAVLQDCQLCSDDSQCLVSLEPDFRVTLPKTGPLVPGHLCVVPVDHKIASTEMDLTEEQHYSGLKFKISDFFQFHYAKKAVFLEFVQDVHQAEHFCVEAFPVSDSQSEQIYSTVLQEFSNCDKKWTDNKKVVFVKGNSLIGHVPSGFSYIFVDFGNKGLVHLIENSEKFKKDYALTLIAECLGVEMLFVRKKVSAVSLSLHQRDYQAKWDRFCSSL